MWERIEENLNIYEFSELNRNQEQGVSIEDVGGKGLSLLEMSQLGVPVPPGFIIPVSACRDFLESGELPVGFDEALERGLKHIESRRSSFGGSSQPLLVSVRSGASVSMPGMMDTVLNVGLLRSNLSGLIPDGGRQSFALDSYRRLQELHCEASSASDALRLSAIRAEVIEAAGVNSVAELSEDWLQGLTVAYDRELASMDRPLPQNP